MQATSFSLIGPGLCGKWNTFYEFQNGTSIVGVNVPSIIDAYGASCKSTHIFHTLTSSNYYSFLGRVSEAQSLFEYTANQDYSYYNPSNFAPSYLLVPLVSISYSLTLQVICGEFYVGSLGTVCNNLIDPTHFQNDFCLYDGAINLQLNEAEASLIAYSVLCQEWSNSTTPVAGMYYFEYNLCILIYYFSADFPTISTYSYTTGPGLYSHNLTSFAQTWFTVYSHDALYNPANHTFTVITDGPAAIDLVVVAAMPGMINYTYVPRALGDYNISVFVQGTGLHISGSPFMTTVAISKSLPSLLFLLFFF